MALSPEREGRLTASWHPEALGYGYLSGKAAWERWHGFSEPDERAKFHMARGVAHESDAIAFAEAVLGNIFDSTGEYQLFTPYEDWCGCTTDGLLEDWGLIECKAPAQMPSSPKEAWWIQVQSQLFITKRHTGYLSAWTDTESCLWKTTADPEYWQKAEPLLKQYLEMLNTDKPPKRWKKPAVDLAFNWERIA